MLTILALVACTGSTPAPEQPAAPVASEADAKLRQMLQPLP